MPRMHCIFIIKRDLNQAQFLLFVFCVCGISALLSHAVWPKGRPAAEGIRCSSHVTTIPPAFLCRWCACDFGGYVCVGQKDEFTWDAAAGAGTGRYQVALNEIIQQHATGITDTSDLLFVHQTLDAKGLTYVFFRPCSRSRLSSAADRVVHHETSRRCSKAGRYQVCLRSDAVLRKNCGCGANRFRRRRCKGRCYRPYKEDGSPKARRSVSFHTGALVEKP